MRKFISILSVFILTISSAMATCSDRWFLTNPCQTEDWPSPFNFSLGGGYRRDNFKWSIAGPHNKPDILSQLQWKNLYVAQIEGSASYVSCRNYAIQINADYGHIYHGKNVDSDYLGDDKTDLFCRSVNKAGKGHVYDLSAGVGYRVTSTCARFVATPLLGYSHHAQYLRIYDGNQVFSLFDDNRGHFPGLNSKYRVHWWGPWLGFTFEARVESCAYVFGSFDWHWVYYRAHGRWNLRTDIGPFQHKSFGQGWGATLGTKWEIWHDWAIGIVATYRNFRTHRGHEYDVFYDPIEGPIHFRTKFNGARWFNGSISGIVTWRF